LERFADFVVKVSFTTIEKYILPFLANTLRTISDARVIVPLVEHLLTFTQSQLIPQKEMKDRLLPLMLVLLSEATTPVETKICILTSLQKLFTMLDAETVKTKVEPALNGVITRERDSKVLMTVVDVYSAMAERYGREMTVHNIIPSLCPLLLSTTLVYDQIHAVSVLISKLVTQIDQERGAAFEAERRAQDRARSEAANPKKEEVVTKFDDYNPHAWKAPTVEAPKLAKVVESPPTNPSGFGTTPAIGTGGYPPASGGWADFSKEPPVKVPSPVVLKSTTTAPPIPTSQQGAFPSFPPPINTTSNAGTAPPVGGTANNHAFSDFDDFFGPKK
jgi:hypothetical protein